MHVVYDSIPVFIVVISFPLDLCLALIQTVRFNTIYGKMPAFIVIIRAVAVVNCASNVYIGAPRTKVCVGDRPGLTKIHRLEMVELHGVVRHVVSANCKSRRVLLAGAIVTVSTLRSKEALSEVYEAIVVKEHARCTSNELSEVFCTMLNFKIIINSFCF